MNLVETAVMVNLDFLVTVIMHVKVNIHFYMNKMMLGLNGMQKGFWYHHAEPTYLMLVNL